MPSSEEYFAAILFNCLHIILCILIIYNGVKFYRFREHQAIQKRYPSFVILQTLCLFLYVLHSILYKGAFIYNHERKTNFTEMNVSSHQIGNTLKHISEILYIFSSHGMIISFIARAYIMFFNTKWVIQMQKSKWSVYLNSDLSSFWFLRHHKHFGSKRYIYLVVLFYYLLVTFTVSILLTLHFVFAGFITAALYLFEILSVIVIWIQIPKFHDVHFIKREMKISFVLCLTALLIYIIWIIIDIVSGGTIGDQLWPFMMSQFLLGTVIGSIAIVINKYVFYVCIHAENIPFTQNYDHIRITDTLSNKELLPLFFKHLGDEWSVELLLSFVEFLQFKNMLNNDARFMSEMISMNPDCDLNELGMYSKKIMLSDELPLSNIVHEKHSAETDNLYRYLLIAHDLYNKYIVSASEWEINISWECRENIKDFMDSYWNDNNDTCNNKYDLYELYSLYHGASLAMYRLMLHSHLRFLRAIFNDKDFRVDVKKNVALQEIKSNKSLQQQIENKNSFTKHRNTLGHKKARSTMILKHHDEPLVDNDPRPPLLKMVYSNSDPGPIANVDICPLRDIGLLMVNISEKDE
eukprot:259505_1